MTLASPRGPTMRSRLPGVQYDDGEHAQARAGQQHGGGGPGDPGTDDDDVIHTGTAREPPREKR